MSVHSLPGCAVTPRCCSTTSYSVLFEIPSRVSSWDLGCLHSLPSLFANPATEGVSLYHQHHHLRNNFCGYEVAGQTTVRKMFFYCSQKRSQKRKQHRPSLWWELFILLRRSGTSLTRLPASWPGKQRGSWLLFVGFSCSSSSSAEVCVAPEAEAGHSPLALHKGFLRIELVPVRL